MMSAERLNLVAPCGIDCGICELYTCRADARLFSALTAERNTDGQDTLRWMQADRRKLPDHQRRM